MSRPLSEEGAIGSAAFLRRPVPLEALLYDRRILPVVVGVHLHVRSGYVNFITTFFDTMIMGLLLVMRTVGITVRTIVQRTVTHETVLEGFVAFFVPFKVTDHLFFLNEHPRITI